MLDKSAFVGKRILKL